MSKILLAFDLYGTLLSTESIAKQLKQFAPFSEITRNTLMHALIENGLQLDGEEIEKLMQAYDSLSIFPDVERALKQLSSIEKIECVVFSNGTKSMVSNSVHRSKGLSPYSSLFKDIITVEGVKRFKPAPEVYEHLAKCVDKVGHEHEVWLISGNPFDIVGARAFGMQAAWVDRAGNGWQDKLGDQPTAILQSLEELERALEAHPK